MSKRMALVMVTLAALLVAALWYFWPPAVPPRPAPASQPVAGPVGPVEPTPVPPSLEPVIQHPMPAVDAGLPAPARKPLPDLAHSDARLKEELTALVGRNNVLRYLLLEGFVRRVVATVDNLGREHAPPAMWPVQPVAGRFTTLAAHDGSGEVISPDNGQRYAALVQFIESVDTRAAVQLYANLYPLFQQAYQELGYPRGYFNDRLVAVIDTLLATPVFDQPLAVSLVEVKGPIAPEQPWTRYEFVDERLQTLAAGQKMLLRTGPVNHRRLRVKLLQLRKLLTRAELPPAARDSAH